MAIHQKVGDIAVWRFSQLNLDYLQDIAEHVTQVSDPVMWPEKTRILVHLADVDNFITQANQDMALNRKVASQKIVIILPPGQGLPIWPYPNLAEFSIGAYPLSDIAGLRQACCQYAMTDWESAAQGMVGSIDLTNGNSAQTVLDIYVNTDYLARDVAQHLTECQITRTSLVWAVKRLVTEQQQQPERQAFSPN